MLESVDVFLVAATFTQAWPIASVWTEIFRVKKIAQQHAGLDVGAVTLDELEHGANALAAVNGKMDVCEDHMQLVRHAGSPRVWRSSYYVGGAVDIGMMVRRFSDHPYAMVTDMSCLIGISPAARSLET